MGAMKRIIKVFPDVYIEKGDTVYSRQKLFLVMKKNYILFIMI